jgi:cyclic pyranopterin phosphate synthase
MPSPGQDPRAPAADYDYTDGRGRVGIIASVSRPFCASCNRLRLTAEGKLRNCLFALDEADVKPLLRRESPDESALSDIIRRTVWAKWEGHEINTARFVKPERTMHAIGG